MKFSEMPYKHIEIDDVKAFFEKLIDDSKKASSGEEQFELHKKYYDYLSELQTMIRIAGFRHDVNTTEEFYAKEKDYIDEIDPIISQYKNEYQKVLYKYPYRAYLEEKIGKVAFKNMELNFASIDEKILPLMQEENALINKYDKIIASAKIPFNGEEYNISLLRKHLTGNDRETRKQAWKALEPYLIFAKTWGNHLIENFIGGIKQKWEDLKQSVSNVAQTVKDFLGFSEPKKGPLSNFHTYAPDMMDLYSKGIKENAGKIEATLQTSLEGVSGFFEPQKPQTATTAATNIFNINISSDAIASDYDAYRAAQKISEELGNLQRMQALAVGA